MSEIGFSAPHSEAARAGLYVLKRGGNAVDAMVAAAAMISVQYPHMNSLGGDGFWIISVPGEAPVAIDACGCAAKNSSIDYFKNQGFPSIPERGHNATLCSAGTVSGWELAREIIAVHSPIASLTELLEPSAVAAESGIGITQSLRSAVALCNAQLTDASYFDVFRSLYVEPLKNKSDTIKNPRLASLFRDLAKEGLNSFYSGSVAEQLVGDLQTCGSFLCAEDFSSYQAKVVEPLSVEISKGKLFNLPAPTQGVASLMILALYDRLVNAGWSEAEHVHALVEATKQAFMIRDKAVTDPSRQNVALSKFLEHASLDKFAADIDLEKARPWPKVATPGDTVWMGAVDKNGVMVSFIQSVYWEFGSCLVLPSYGLSWNNRGISFSLDETHPNALSPGMKPFHTLNPAFAELENGSRMVYGTMGGEGQPQTQAAIISRYGYQNVPLEDSIAQPRWLLGRTWGETSSNLKIEQPLFERVGHELSLKGHETEKISGLSEKMGHAGALVLSAQGELDVATDPRSDGAALKEVI